MELPYVAQIWVPSNPRGAERLPPGIVATESDLYPRRLWGDPSEVIFFFFSTLTSNLVKN